MFPFVRLFHQKLQARAGNFIRAFPPVLEFSKEQTSSKRNCSFSPSLLILVMFLTAILFRSLGITCRGVSEDIDRLTTLACFKCDCGVGVVVHRARAVDNRARGILQETTFSKDLWVAFTLPQSHQEGGFRPFDFEYFCVQASGVLLELGSFPPRIRLLS